MKPAFATLSGSLLCLAIASAASAADHLLLRADFNHLAPGDSPGNGGAEAGEPVQDGGMLVGGPPLSTPNLQIRDMSDCCAVHTRFEFLGGEELTHGTVQLRANVLFTGDAGPTFGIREQGSSATTFLNVYSANGSAFLGYAGSTYLGMIGAAPSDVVLPLAIDVSAEHRLVSVRVGETTWIDRAEIDLSTTRGVGAFIVGVLHNPALSDDVMRMDDVRVVACESPEFADCLLVAGFEG